MKTNFTGHIDESLKHLHLASSDCFILPSLHEGFGLVFLEAMQHGLPIITTNRGGQQDFLKNNKTGFITPIKDPQAIATAINKLYINQKLRKNIRTYNLLKVKYYSISKIAPMYEKLYNQLLNH